MNDVSYQVPLIEPYLLSGRLAEGEAALAERLTERPDDAQAQFGLGAVQFLRGVERLMQSLHRYGLRTELAGIARLPFLRLPDPPNPHPQTISYSASRQIIQTWLDDLARAAVTLALVPDGEVKLPLHFGLIRLDLDGDGQATEEETLWRIYARLNPAAGATIKDPDGFVITFDAGDVHWLRGYCHLLMALGEIVLAVDNQLLFEHTAHLFFARPDSPYGFLQTTVWVWASRVPVQLGFDITDAIAFVHLLIRQPIAEPARLATALGHLESTVAQSRQSWKCILAETDDDHEWIPNPNQTGVIPDVRITPEMVDVWTEFLDEVEEVLAGRKLIPFWRTDAARSSEAAMLGGRGSASDAAAHQRPQTATAPADERHGTGVNLRRVFTDPPDELDLVLWIQGAAAAPYLEEGELISPELWQRIQRVYGRQFTMFAVWFN